MLDKDPYEVTCGDFLDNGGAHEVAAKVVGDVTAPRLSRKDEEGVIALAIAATCAQASIPGVSDPRDYKPVGPVLKGVEAGG